MNFDYIPLDQAIIDREVEMAQSRRESARALLAEAVKTAGGNYDIIAFRNARKRIINALEELKIFWCESDDGEILVSRHELNDIMEKI